jgi:hypothetical protein
MAHICRYPEEQPGNKKRPGGYINEPTSQDMGGDRVRGKDVAGRGRR